MGFVVILFFLEMQQNAAARQIFEGGRCPQHACWKRNVLVTAVIYAMAN